MGESLVPDDFVVPRSFTGHGFRLEPLGPDHNDRDHVAWMSSIGHIRSTPGFDSPDASWPSPMSLEQNHQDLVDHARDFEQRTGFTYSILDGEEVIGCVYIYPASNPDNDARVRSWVRESHAHMDRLVWRELSDWIRTEWPFSNPVYAPRP